MQKEFRNILNIIIAYAVALLIFTVVRVYFLGVMVPGNGTNSDLNLTVAFLYGFVYDAEFVFGVNGIIILLFFLPVKLRNTIFWQFIVRALFAVLNSFLILIYILDAKYYHLMNEHIRLFNLSDESIFKQFVHSVQKLEFQFNNSWDILLLSLVVFIGLWYVFPSINKMFFERSKANLYARYAASLLGVLLFLNILIRLNDNSGSWQTRVFKRMDKPTAILAINSPYAISKFYLSEQLAEEKYFDRNDLGTMFPVEKEYLGKTANKRNLFLFNISLNRTEWNKIKPEFDELGVISFISDNFSCTEKSNPMQMDELLLSVPGFNKVGLMRTNYAFNHFQTLANILKRYNYHSVMATNMPDSKYLNSSLYFYGFDKLIIDGNSNKLFAKLNKELNLLPESLFFVFFQMESGVGNLVDFVKQNDLLDKSLIVINLSFNNEGSDINYGKTIFLIPDEEKEIFIADKVQNTDILPSVIDYLNLDKKFISFGQSVFYQRGKHSIFQYTGKDYIILEDSLLLRYNGKSTKWLVDYKHDPDEFFDLQDSLPVQKVQMENKIRAIIQQYNNKLINNEMTP
jgi:hypothetical protein